MDLLDTIINEAEQKEYKKLLEKEVLVFDKALFELLLQREYERKNPND